MYLDRIFFFYIKVDTYCTYTFAQNLTNIRSDSYTDRRYSTHLNEFGLDSCGVNFLLMEKVFNFLSRLEVVGQRTEANVSGRDNFLAGQSPNVKFVDSQHTVELKR